MMAPSSEFMKKFWSKKGRKQAASLRMKKRMNDPEYKKKMRKCNMKYPIDEYPMEVKAFIRLQKRAANGYTTTNWSHDVKGFYKFLKTVGQMPKGMKKPSIGRKNHLKGYQSGNCKWQENLENGIEAFVRARKAREKNPKLATEFSRRISVGLKGKKKSKEHRLALSVAARNRSESYRLALSIAAKQQERSNGRFV